MATLSMFMGLLGASVVSSLVPVVNAEALLLAAVFAAPALTLPIVAIVAGGQVVGKIVLYRGGSGLHRLGKPRAEGRIQRLTERLGARPGALRITLLVSAVVGLPPLYAMAVVCGAARLPMRQFVGLCLVGRLARFYSLALVPGLVR